MMDPQYDGDHRPHIRLIVDNKNAGHGYFRIGCEPAYRQISNFDWPIGGFIFLGKEAVTPAGQFRAAR
jgi:hypothetical protein